MNTATLKKSGRLTEQDVHSAMKAMIAEGEKPSALNLLKVLGRGSLTTISKFMNSFNKNEDKAALNSPALIDIPRELGLSAELLVKKIWLDARALANQEIETQRATLMQAEADAAAKVTEAMAFSEEQAAHIEELENLLEELRGIIAEKDISLLELTADVKNLTQALNEEKKAKALAVNQVENNNKIVKILEEEKEKLSINAVNDRKNTESTIEARDKIIKELEKNNKALELQIGKQQTALDHQTGNLDIIKKELAGYKNDCKIAEELAAKLAGKLEVYEQQMSLQINPGKPKKDKLPRKKAVIE